MFQEVEYWRLFGEGTDVLVEDLERNNVDGYAYMGNTGSVMCFINGVVS